MKPTLTQIGPEPGYQPNSNGNTQPRRFQRKETSLKPSNFIRRRCQRHRAMDNSPKCLAMFGNGPVAHTRRIPVIARSRARLANTMANSCAINTSCGAVRAQHRAPTFARLIEISFNLTNGGNSWGSVWRAIFRERQIDRDSSRKENLPRGSTGRPLCVAEKIALQVFLRPTRRAAVPANLQSFGILCHPDRDRDLAIAWR